MSNILNCQTNTNAATAFLLHLAGLCLASLCLAQTTRTLDPSSPLESRIAPASIKVIDLLASETGIRPKDHVPTNAERKIIAGALAILPPLEKKILKEHLFSISLLDDMPNTALTSPQVTGSGIKALNITIRAGVLKQSASEWLTEKEQGYFAFKNSNLSVRVDAGSRAAIQLVLLHEAAHVVDSVLGISTGQESSLPLSGFKQGVWSDRLVPAPQFAELLKDFRKARLADKSLDAEWVVPTYHDLARTPFVSLYAAGNWFDDLAEFVAVSHWTTHLHQPYRIIITRKGKRVFEYLPMQSPEVKRRLSLIDSFYVT